MLVLHQATNHQLSKILDRPEFTEIEGLRLPKNEEIAPRFWLEFLLGKLDREPENNFWWCPRIIAVDELIVGMCGFKSPPDPNGLVEIGYGIVPSQQGRGFATEAVNLLLEEGFSRTEIETIVAYTVPSNLASQRVLEKNQFVLEGSKIDPEDGEILIWEIKR